MPSIHSPYLYDALNPEENGKIVSGICRFLRRKAIRDTFDGIAFTGLSGALIAAPVAVRLKMPMLAIRKQDGSHSGCAVEGDRLIKNYIIIDEMVSSGNTIDTIRTKCTDFNSSHNVGIVLYRAASILDTLKAYSQRWNTWVWSNDRKLYAPYIKTTLQPLPPTSIVDIPSNSVEEALCRIKEQFQSKQKSPYYKPTYIKNNWLEYDNLNYDFIYKG